jgi:hypothetical protein
LNKEGHKKEICDIIDVVEAHKNNHHGLRINNKSREFDLKVTLDFKLTNFAIEGLDISDHKLVLSIPVNGSEFCLLNPVRQNQACKMSYNITYEKHRPFKDRNEITAHILRNVKSEKVELDGRDSEIYMYKLCTSEAVYLLW